MTQRKTATLLALLMAFSLTEKRVSADDGNLSSASTTSSSSGDAPRPFTLFGGIGTGYGGVSSGEYAQAPSGTHVLVSALAAVQLYHWEFDGGVSWLYSRLSGMTSDNLPIAVRTRAGTFDLGARYRLGSHWQVGPAVNLAFGADTSFSPSVGQSQTSLLVGLKALYELPKMPIPLRLWAQLSTDASIADRRFIVGLAGVQIGIPVTVHRHPTLAQVGHEDAVHLSSAAPVNSSNNEVRVVLDAQKVFFGSNSKDLKANVAEILKEVGQYLKDSPNQHAEILISGHADQRGRFSYNLKLSQKRADMVKEALVSGGADPSNMEVKAYSYSKLLDPRNTRTAWARNRRVELTFQDVHDPKGLRDKLRPLAFDAPKETP